MFVPKMSRQYTVLIATAAIAAVAATIALPALSQSTVAQLPPGVAATVNGRPIPEEVIAAVERQLSQQNEPIDRDLILSELIDLEVLTQRAEAQKLDEKASVAASLHLLYSQTMANAYLDSISDDIELSKDAVRAEYDRLIRVVI